MIILYVRFVKTDATVECAWMHVPLRHIIERRVLARTPQGMQEFEVLEYNDMDDKWDTLLRLCELSPTSAIC